MAENRSPSHELIVNCSGKYENHPTRLRLTTEDLSIRPDVVLSPKHSHVSERCEPGPSECEVSCLPRGQLHARFVQDLRTLTNRSSTANQLRKAHFPFLLFLCIDQYGPRRQTLRRDLLVYRVSSHSSNLEPLFMLIILDFSLDHFGRFLQKLQQFRLCIPP